MAQSATSQQPSEATTPEKTAPAQLNTMPPHNRYTLQPAQFQPLDAPKPGPFRPSKMFSMGKLVLGTANFTFAIIVLGLSIGVLTVELYDIVVIITAGVMAIVSILWQIAEFLTIAVRRSIYRTIHPGAHVGIHLILWMLALLVTVSFFTTLAYELGNWTVDAQCGDNSSGYYSTPSSDSSSSYTYCDYYTFSTDAKARLYLGMMQAVTAFSLLMLMCHFALFVMACIETDRRRKWNKQSKVVYLVATSGPVDGRTYYTQVPGPAAQQQQQQQVQRQSAVQQERTVGPHQEAYGYFAPPAPAAASAAHHSKPEREQRDSQEVTAGPSTASYA